MKKLFASCVFAGAVLAMPLGARAEEPPQAAPAAGLRVYRDPQDGRLLATPATPEQREQARQGLPRRNDALLREEAVPGGVLLHSNGQLRMSSVVTRTPDGRFEESCEQSAAQPAEPEHAP